MDAILTGNTASRKLWESEFSAYHSEGETLQKRVKGKKPEKQGRKTDLAVDKVQRSWMKCHNIRYIFP
jgi:hypothetical protein